MTEFIMTAIRCIVIGVPLFVLFSVLVILALGPAYLDLRAWWRQKKSDEFEQKHGYKPRKKRSGGHF